MSSNKLRVITGLVMAVVLIPLVFLGGYFFYALLLFASYVGTYELVRMHNNKRGLPKILTYTIPIFGVLVNVVVMTSDILPFDMLRNLLFFGLVTGVSLFILTLFVKPMKLTDMAYYAFCICYGGASFAVMGTIRSLNYTNAVDLNIGYNIDLAGLSIFFYVVACSLGCDIGAYEVGMKFGKNKLIPDVSPNKTIEGSIGGALTGGILGTVVLIVSERLINYRLFLDVSLWLEIIIVLILSILMAVISQIGDLLASKLKREYEIKDYGNIFPGHGGIMDRFDSLILSSAFMLILLIVFGVIL